MEFIKAQNMDKIDMLCLSAVALAFVFNAVTLVWAAVVL